MLLVSLSLLFVQNAYAFTVPANDGFVTDEVGVFSESEELALEKTLQEYKDETSNEIAILVVRTLQDEVPIDVAVDVFRDWGLGDTTKDNGLLLLFSYEDRTVQFTTGYGLEGVLPDLLTAKIFETDMKEFFRSGQYFEGFVSGIDSIQKHIGGEYTAERYEQKQKASPIPIFYFLFIFAEAILRLLAGTRSWWLGGIFGFILGVVLTFLYSSWLSIPFLIIIGLFVDYVVSRSVLFKNSSKSGSVFTHGRSRRSSRGGGFRGFGGGSTGGGGSINRF